MVATARTKLNQTRRGFNFPACDSIYRYQAPYNTGNDFVYNDNFTDPIAHYKEITFSAALPPPPTP